VCGDCTLTYCPWLHRSRCSDSAMAGNPEWSKENHFVQLVSTRLRSAMANPDFWCTDDHDYNGGHIGLDLPLAACGCGGGNVDNRLCDLESAVKRMENTLNIIYEAVCPKAGGKEPIHVDDTNHSPPQRSPKRTGRPLCPLRGSSSTGVVVSSGSSSASSPCASPKEFQFVCPLCHKPQFTPKSHCEHLRNVVSDGNHNCRFILDHPLHDRISVMWGSADNFVRWYCSFLRSGMGSKFNESDMQDYTEVQQAMQNVLSGLVRVQL
jgi:hypothetical protein